MRSINSRHCAILLRRAGRHRLEAVLRLKWENIPVYYMDRSENECRLWEIAENLHRSELTVDERSSHIAEWIRLTNRKEVGQVAQPKKKGGKQPADRGISEAARKINVERTDARRAIKIDSRTPEAKQACRDAGLDDNQSALLKVASAPADQQVEMARQLAEKPRKSAQKNKPAAKPAPVADPAPDANEKVVLFLMDAIGDRLGELVELLEGAVAGRKTRRFLQSLVHDHRIFRSSLLRMPPVHLGPTFLKSELDAAAK